MAYKIVVQFTTEQLKILRYSVLAYRDIVGDSIYDINKKVHKTETDEKSKVVLEHESKVLMDLLGIINAATVKNNS